MQEMRLVHSLKEIQNILKQMITRYLMSEDSKSHALTTYAVLSSEMNTNEKLYNTTQ